MRESGRAAGDKMRRYGTPRTGSEAGSCPLASPLPPGTRVARRDRRGFARRRGAGIVDLPGILLDNLAEFAAEFLFGSVNQFLQLGNRLPDFGKRVGPMVSGAQLGVGRGQRFLVVEIKLFVELLPGPDARKADLDRIFRQARQADQVAGQVDDLHRLAHLQDEDFAALAHRRGLQHQLRGLRDGHEETGHAGIGDGDRSAAADLVLEDRHHAAVGPQHVAEPHHGEAGRRDLRHGVDEALGNLLRHAHDARGMDRLVGGDEDEVPHAELVGHFGHDLGAADVVADRFADVHFHQGHVLVRGGVENDLRMKLREELPHAGLVGDVGNARLQHGARGRSPAACARP